MLNAQIRKLKTEYADLKEKHHKISEEVSQLGKDADEFYDKSKARQNEADKFYDNYLKQKYEGKKGDRKESQRLYDKYHDESMKYYRQFIQSRNKQAKRKKDASDIQSMMVSWESEYERTAKRYNDIILKFGLRRPTIITDPTYIGK